MSDWAEQSQRIWDEISELTDEDYEVEDERLWHEADEAHEKARDEALELADRMAAGEDAGEDR